MHIKKLIKWFDFFEDDIRSGLSRKPFLYSVVGGVGVVLFWRGVWHAADELENMGGFLSMLFSPIGSILIGVLILISTGLFVSIFIGDSIIMSGIKREKKVIEKTDDEIVGESKVLRDIERKVDHIEHDLHP